MNYLFWNTNKNKNINTLLVDLIKSYNCEVLTLAEYEDDVIDLQKKLDIQNINLYHVPSIMCKKIALLTKYNKEKIKHGPESKRYTIKIIPHDNLHQIILALVHLPSKMHSDSGMITEELRSLVKDIEEVEKNNNNCNTIITGDFNLNPFEDSMVSASGLHSLNNEEISLKKKRVILGREYRYFYNPMWKLWGKQNFPGGTYYYNSSYALNYFWNIFDQVIIRPDLISNFNQNNLKIITEINGVNLLNTNGIPNRDISDHLPLFFEIK